MQQPLSRQLADMLSGPDSAGLTLNRLLERTEGRSLYLVIMILCLPFVIPFSLPGLSTVMGTMIILLALRLAVGKAPRLPRFLGERELPRHVQDRVVGGSVKFLRFVERFVRPRRTRWLAHRGARFFNSLMISLLAFLLALPLPAPPFFFSNSIPSYGIILLAAAMMEEDGVLIWLGYLALAGNLVFFGLIAGVIGELFLRVWHAVGRQLGG